MASQPFKPSAEELKFFAVATLVTGLAYGMYSSLSSLSEGLFFLGIGSIVLFSREIGQRIIAYWMDADVELDISIKGSVVTIFGAFIAILTSLPFILLFPVENRYSTKSYEQWGKSIDAIWLRRQFWLVTGGILMLFLGWGVSYWLGQPRIAKSFSLFLLFQLLPFDYNGIPTGRLDGSIVLRQSGFMWLIYLGLGWVTLGLLWV